MRLLLTGWSGGRHAIQQGAQGAEPPCNQFGVSGQQGAQGAEPPYSDFRLSRSLLKR